MRLSVAVKENSKFVQAIREDLRRNNDDYVAPEVRERSQGLAPSNTKLRKPAAPQPQVKPPETRRANNATGNLTAPADANGTLFRSNTQKPDALRQQRIEKLKRLIDMGKSRLRKLLIPGGTSTGIWPGSFESELTTPSPEIGGFAAPVPALMGVPAVSSEQEGDATRRPERHHRGDARSSPSPDQLDMAPARGVHVHMMRLQGRLCERIKLNPEGPVYDRHGKIIMKAHALENAHGREFPLTRAPHHILPRCCNCCKKSLLGCQ